MTVLEGYARPKTSIPRPTSWWSATPCRRGNPEVEEVLDRDSPTARCPSSCERVFLPGRDPRRGHGHPRQDHHRGAHAPGSSKTAGLDPSWLVGGVPARPGKGLSLGAGAPFVLEGDEYDTAFFDKRPKFLHYRPRVRDPEQPRVRPRRHLPRPGAHPRVFRHLLRIVPRAGLVVANADDPEMRALLPLCPCPVETYSVEGREADWRGTAAAGHAVGCGGRGAPARCSPRSGGRAPGLEPPGGRRRLPPLRGVRRGRWKRGRPASGASSAAPRSVGEAGGVRVYDDFAHHPTAIRGTLEGFRDRFPGRRIWAVLEPRSNTMRRRIFQEDLPRAFDAADRVAIRAVPDPEKAPPGSLLDVAKVAEALAPRRKARRRLPRRGGHRGAHSTGSPERRRGRDPLQRRFRGHSRETSCRAWSRSLKNCCAPRMLCRRSLGDSPTCLVCLAPSLTGLLAFGALATFFSDPP